MKTTKEKIAVMQAFEEGKKIEANSGPDGEWIEARNPTWDWAYYEYRVATEPKLRPWKPEEVPILAMLRPKGAAEFRRDTICSVAPDGVIYIGNGWIDLKNAVHSLEHSTDGGKTWQPCGVLE